MSIHWIDGPTEESVAAARAAQQADRDAIYRATGVRFTDTGRAAVIIHCPRSGCRYAASAKREARALLALSAHLIRGHAQEKEQ